MCVVLTNSFIYLCLLIVKLTYIRKNSLKDKPLETCSKFSADAHMILTAIGPETLNHLCFYNLTSKRTLTLFLSLPYFP